MAAPTRARVATAITPKRGKRIGVRHILVAVVAGYIAQRRILRPLLLPYGPAVLVPPKDRPVYGSIDYDNDSLATKRKHELFFMERYKYDHANFLKTVFLSCRRQVAEAL